ncbi:6351_t:CDS:2 [Entrophospora sp. SA101]|nr:6351_t:CDS:2 [Entrophospora sp. SA101]
MIKNISKVKTLEESEKLLKRIYSSHSLFSSEIRLSLEVAIRASAEKILDTFYWERNVSESHISHGMFLDLFVNLFYDGMKYLVDDQKKRDLECLVIEHGKFEAVIDNGKALSDRGNVIESLKFDRIYREEMPEYGGYGYLINMNSVEFSIQEVNKYGEIKKIEEKLNKLRI